jgi:hypothetical protein
MKNLIIVFTLLLSILSNGLAQLPYYDALRIKTLIGSNPDTIYGKIRLDSTNREIFGILSNYVTEKNKIITNIASIFISNPFISFPYISKKDLSNNTLRYQPENIQGNTEAGDRNLVLGHNIYPSLPSPSLSIFSGLNVTNFADGVAKFMVDRFKDELSSAFFEKFKNDLDNPKYSDLKILFPETWKTLMSIDQNIYVYSNYLNTLRQSFIGDMTNTFVNLQNLLNQQKYKDYFIRQRPELGSILYSSLYFINGLSSGKHPGDVLANYKPDNLINLNKKDSILQYNIRNSFKLIKLLSSTLRSKSSNNYWVPADSVRNLVEDPISFKIFLGLLYQNDKDSIKIIFRNSNNKEIKLTDILTSLANDRTIDNLNLYRDLFETFIDKAQEINENISELKTKKKSDIDFNDYYKLFNSSLDLLSLDTSFMNLPYLNLESAQKNGTKNMSSKVLYVAHSSGELYIDVRTKNYSSGIMNAIDILDTLLNFNSAFNNVSLNDSLNQLTGSYDDIKNSIITTIDKYDPSKSTQKYYDIKFTAVSKIKVADEINKLLELKCSSLKSNTCLNSIKFTLRRIQFLSNYKKHILRTILNYKLEELANKKIDLNFVRSNFVVVKDTNIQKLVLNLIIAQRNLLTSAQKGEIRQFILKYGSFIASVAQAQNSDDFKNAIESVALPAGSYSIKQHSKLSLALNGYMGYGWDWNQFFTNSSLIMHGVYAPIGLSLSHQIIIGKTNFGACSIFLSLIDVGGLAAYRLSSSTDTLKQQVTLQSILSPSLQLIYELKGTPLSFCFGGRITPRLLYEGKNYFENIKSNYVINASILIDIPIINLKNWN